MSSKNHEESGYDLILDLLTISFILIACFTSYQKGGLVGNKNSGFLFFLFIMKGDHLRPIYVNNMGITVDNTDLLNTGV